MKFTSKIFIIFIFCTLLSLTCVSAYDGQVADNLTVAENENILQSDDYRTFSELNQSINASDDHLDLKYDYKCEDGFKDYNIAIKKTNFEINGNGHTIDANNKSSIFGIGNSAVIFNNLTFKNGINGFINIMSSNVTFNNVKFISSDVSNHSFVFAAFSKINFTNCSFYSSAHDFMGICSKLNDIVIKDSNFVNGGNGTNIQFNRGSLTLIGTTFQNSNSSYGAINFKGHSLTVKRSKFLNSYAKLTGGAILAKYFPLYDVNGSVISSYILIEDCEFRNVSSSHNGGAIYVDLDSGSEYYVIPLNITNCNFTDCSSGFGGAIVQTGGILNINNSRFINNTASHYGGAVYAVSCLLNIAGSILVNNIAKFNAGALYYDTGYLIINASNFTANKVINSNSKTANAVYAHDVSADILNSTFENGGIAIYANFADRSNLKDIISTDLFLMNNTDYIVSVENNGIKLNLTKNSIVVDKIPSKFDLRDWGWVTQVKDQGDDTSCWAFATAAALESTLLRATNVSYDISEDNIQNLQLRYFITGDVRNNGTGFAYSGLGHSLSWQGIITYEDDPYDERGMISDVAVTDKRIHLQDAMIIFGGQNNTMDLIKQAILKYGPVTIQFNPVADSMKQIYIYSNKVAQPTHFVPIIGWDDTIPAEKFKINDGGNISVPEGPGGWLIKDSQGPDYFDQGYYYLSYYDKTFMVKDNMAIVPQYAAIAYIFENANDYHVNYQTDITGLTGFDGDYKYYSNEFVSKYDELIGAVGTYFNESGISYSFDIYINGVKVHSQNGISEFAGFRTIVLNKYIPINTGDRFKVVFKNNNVPYQAYSRINYMSGMTFVSGDGKNWEDFTLSLKTVCLKVYTLRDDTKIIGNKNIAVDYSGGSYFSVKVVTSDGRAVGAGAIVKFTINGKTYTVKTDVNGIAKVKISDLPKKYTITTNYNGKTYKNTVTVKQVLKTSKVAVKKTAKKFTLKAKLKINGKLVKGKVIKFKFKGKTYKAKTNKKGIAKVTIKKKVIKKLKKGKKYSVKVTYLKDTIKTTVRVK